MLATNAPEASICAAASATSPIAGSRRAAARLPGQNLRLLVAPARLLRKEPDESAFERVFPGSVLQLIGTSGGENLASVHRDQPVESFRFVHVGGRNQYAHARTANPDTVD